MLISRRIIGFIFICLLHTQNWQPFHIEELSKYQNYEFDYRETDNRAQNLPINQQDRGILTHDVIGYLPYWEYSQYSDFNYELLSEINFFSAELASNGELFDYVAETGRFSEPVCRFFMNKICFPRITTPPAALTMSVN